MATMDDLWAKYFSGGTPNELLKSSQTLATTEKGYRDYVAAMLQKIGGMDSEAALAGRNAETAMEQALRTQGIGFDRKMEANNNQFADQGILRSGIALDAQGRTAGDYLNTVNDIRSGFSGSMDQMYQSLANQKAQEAANLARQDQARAESQAQWGQYMAQMQAQQAAQQQAQQAYQQQIQQLLTQQGVGYQGGAGGANTAGRLPVTADGVPYTPGPRSAASSGIGVTNADAQPQQQPQSQPVNNGGWTPGPNSGKYDWRTGELLPPGVQPLQSGGANVIGGSVPAGGIPTNVGANTAGQVTNPTAGQNTIQAVPQTQGHATAAQGNNRNLPGTVTNNPMPVQNPNVGQTTASGVMANSPTGGIQASGGIPTGPNAPKPAPAQAPALPPTGLLGQLGLQYGHVDGTYAGQYQNVGAGVGSSMAPLIATPWTPAQLQAQQAAQNQQQANLLGPQYVNPNYDVNNNPGIIRTY